MRKGRTGRTLGRVEALVQSATYTFLDQRSIIRFLLPLIEYLLRR